MWVTVFDVSRAAPLKVSFLEIGEGSAALVRVGPNYEILIDGGPGKKILKELPKEMTLGDKNIDLVMLSHSDRDHLGGIIQVLKRYRVKHFAWNGIEKSEGSTIWKNFFHEAEKEWIASKGFKAQVGEVKVEVLSPSKDKKPKNPNDSSLVVKLSQNKTSFLFPGDISTSQEEKIKNVSCTVLHAAHHGSKTSTGVDFLNRSKPQIAVIQAGKDNSYDHPHQEVLDRLDKSGAQIYRTDKDGRIIVLSDGKNLVVKK